MPTLPLPPRAPIGAGDLVVSSDADVLAVLPYFVQESDTAPVRDAIVAALREMFLELQRRDDYAAGQADPDRATGIYEDGVFADRTVFRQSGEDNETYRARGLTFQDLVTPAAILAAANAILSPYTAVQARYFEELDGFFASDGTAAWESFVYDAASWTTPYYPDRMYVDDSAADGLFCPGRAPGGAVTFADEIGRIFVLRVPDLSAVDDSRGFSFADSTDPVFNAEDEGDFFVSDGVTAPDLNETFVQADSVTQYDIYNAIVTSIERIKGHSIRWSLYVDPLLVS